MIPRSGKQRNNFEMSDRFDCSSPAAHYVGALAPVSQIANLFIF